MRTYREYMQAELKIELLDPRWGPCHLSQSHLPCWAPPPITSKKHCGV